MQFANLVILSLGAIASVDAVDCWKSGPTVKVDDIAPSIPTICNYLSAVYTKHENRYQCVQDLAGVKWDFGLTVSRALIIVWQNHELTVHSSSATWTQGQSPLKNARTACTSRSNANMEVKQAMEIGSTGMKRPRRTRWVCMLTNAKGGSQ